MGKMQSFVYILCVFTISASYDIKPKEYIVNLDLPPEQRWTPVLQQAKDAKEAFVTTIKLILDFVPTEFQSIVEKMSHVLDQYLPKEYVSEMKGIAKYFNLSAGDVYLANIFYDYEAFCTSIVAQDSKGNIWHGRNLDYYFPAELRVLTAVIQFQRHGKVVYKGTTFLGMVGLITGQKPNVFTISLDERDKGSFWMNLMVSLFDKKAQHNFFLIRKVLASAPSYEDAVSWLQDADTLAPAYFIVGGAARGQGAVVTHGRVRTVDTWTLAPEYGRWFLVQTNYDHWEQPPKGDDRRHPAIKYMQAIGQNNITLPMMYKVLSTPPVLNNLTAYTTLMSAAHPDMYSTTIRYYKT